MSDKVGQIIDAMKVQIASTLGPDWSELCYVLDISKNAFENGDNGFGVRPLAMERSEGPMKQVAWEQVFEVVLTDSYINELGDEDQRLTARLLYDKMDDVAFDMYNKAFKLTPIVYSTRMQGAPEPEYIEEDNMAVLRAAFVVTYLNDVNC